MKQSRLKRVCLAGISTVVLSMGMSAMASAESLVDALSLAYDNNPELEAQRAALRATDESVPQAKAGYRPSIEASGSVGKTETSGLAQQLRNVPPERLTPKQGSLTLRQPVFRGFSTMNAISQAKREVMAGRADLFAAEQNTLLQAVSAYMNVVRDEAVLELNDNQVEVLRRQLEASQNRFEVGEITRTDVAQSEARLAGALSGRIAAEAQLTASRTQYARVVGKAPGTLEPPPPLPDLPESEEAAIALAEEANPTLVAALYREEAARFSVDSAAGELLPRVDIQAQWSKGRDTFLEGINSETKQVTAQITVPFYQGGAEYSRVRQAKQRRSQRQLESVAARRQVREEVRNAWIQLRAARSTIEASRSQVNASEIALEGVRQEADVGARTVLDVLDAEQEYLDARVELVRTETNEYIAAYTLLAAVGRLTVAHLSLPVAEYDPTENYDDVNNQWFGWSVD